MKKNPGKEAAKDTARTALFGAVSTIVTYVLKQILPDLPEEVVGAILVLVTLLLVYVDSKLHHSDKTTLNGLTNF